MSDDRTALSDDLRVEDDGWRLVESGWERERAVAVGSNFMVGNGYLGYRGTNPEQAAGEYVALVVADTYDCADGRWRELTTAPNPLLVRARIGGVDVATAAGSDVTTGLDLGCGRYESRFTQQVGEASVTVAVERLASYDQLHLLAQRWTMISDHDVMVELETGIDGEVWSLNGVHLPQLRFDVTDAPGPVVTATGVTAESGIEVVVAATCTVSGGSATPEPGRREPRQWFDRCRVSLTAGAELVVETTAAVASSNDGPDPARTVIEVVQSARRAGYPQLLDANRRCWETIWRACDVTVGGSPIDQAALRFSTYHNRICTPAHTDHLPIGARGLSCQAYQGAAFWDQEVYNLPPFLFTEPEIARALLVYRHRTLDGARRKADRLGYDGAYYAWISGTTGDELCPDVFFVDVLTGRPIRNHFNVWQMHISPDIVTAVARYVDVTGDVEYLVDHGAEIAFEVARFLRSFVRYDEWREVYHCIRLLGPDEWHENVDDNAFTNYQAHAALNFAIDSYDRLADDHPQALTDLAGRLDLAEEEVSAWRRIRDRLLLPEPDPETGLIEQFDGFFQLEDVGPDEVRSRLLDPGEYWGWPNGVAVSTQVAKQADVAMLLWLQGHEFDVGTARANYDYYEPRCAHGSSLSHAAYGMLAARIGDVETAMVHFRETATVDLLNTQHAVVGGTFIGGVHTAACGGTHQLAVQGFGGLDFADGRLTINPVLPSEWTRLHYPVRWRGCSLSVTVTADALTVESDTGSPGPVPITVRGGDHVVEPGGSVRIPVPAADG